jgi:integral membrane protein
MKLFQEHEAWVLFKSTAIGEACGWSLLLYGIAAAHYHLPGATFMLPLGGSIHGMLFLAYLGVIMAGFTSLNWSWRKAGFAIFMSVVPFATWAFEAWCAARRRQEALGSYRQIMAKPLISHGDKFLAAQLSTGVEWVIPGDFVKAGETLLQSAERITLQMTGVKPIFEVKPVASPSGPSSVNFYLTVTNSRDFHLHQIEPKLKQSMAVDDINFVAKAQIPELNSLDMEF